MYTKRVNHSFSKIAPGSELETQVISDYRSGSTLKEIGNKIGLSESVIHRALKRANEPTRPRGYKKYQNDGLTYNQRSYRKLSSDNDRYKKYTAYKYEYHLRSKFGLSKEEYDEILESQDNCCAICKRTKDEAGRLVVDHEHATGNIRGILCDACNSALGYLRDSPVNLQAAIEYLGLPPYKSNSVSKKR